MVIHNPGGWNDSLPWPGGFGHDEMDRDEIVRDSKLKTNGMLRPDGTLGLDPVYEVDGWKTYVVYPVPQRVIESYELAMGMRMQERRLAQKYRDLRRPVPASLWTL